VTPADARLRPVANVNQHLHVPTAYVHPDADVVGDVDGSSTASASTSTAPSALPARTAPTGRRVRQA
jgi:hypothetical protein